MRGRGNSRCTACFKHLHQQDVPDLGSPENHVNCLSELLIFNNLSSLFFIFCNKDASHIFLKSSLSNVKMILFFNYFVNEYASKTIARINCEDSVNRRVYHL